ncbi:MAG: chemotaxis protein CheA [Sphingomonas sp. 28-66-16]|nr:MAG: chemotaxis protein CheA [Sphingomonas sp. 28-66-16]
MDDLLQEFIAETRETLEALAGEIVVWETNPADRQRLDAIFRFVHTVKGSCGFLDLPRLSRLSHAAEDVLASVRSGARVADTALVNGVLAIVDRIGEIIEAIDVGASLDDSGEDLLIAAVAEGGVVATAQPATAQPTRAPTRSVRLNVDLLDRMMSGMSDMVLARNELARRLRDGDIDPAVEAALERLSLTVADMRDTVTRTRMQTIDALFSALPRLVRDTAAELGKAVTLTVDGAHVELDREMIEMMRDPIVHIIRNAIDHGIEAPATRLAAGKRENGRLTVAARQSGNQIIIEVTDDGRGIDIDRLITNLAASGGRSESALRALPERAQLDLVFEPGLSSKNDVTAISGRGVGMDVVRANIEQIGGRIELINRPGQGLSIAIYVPLTLSIISTLVVGSNGQRFALPRQSIEEIVTLRGDAIRVDLLGDTPIATVRGRRLPLVSLGAVLGLAPVGELPPMLAIVAVPGGSFVLALDAVFDTEELVIKPAPPAIMSTGFYAGQTLPDTGRPMLLLDCAGVAAAAGLTFGREAMAAEPESPAEPVAPGVPMLLFDDLDGCRRAVPLDVIERVEQIASDSVHFTAGRLRMSIDGMILPLATITGSAKPVAPAGRSDITVLRMSDGRAEVGYAIAEAIDIIALREPMQPARLAGPIAGVVSIDGDQVEILDVHWLFATNLDDVAPARRPALCLLAGAEVPWMERFLRPVLEGAGYRVVTALAEGERATVALAMDGETVPTPGDVPVLRLCDAPAGAGAGGAIYRYDRDALLRHIAGSRATGAVA